MGKFDKDSLAFEMAKQLHEQYAVNDNAKTKNVIAFLSAIAFVFVGFGYVYLQPYIKSEVNEYQQILLMANAISDVILTLLAVLCVAFGYSTRRDHIVIEKIRENEGVGEWYGNGRNKTIRNYLPDYYLIIFIFSFFIQLLITIGYCFNTGVEDCCCKVLSIIFFVISFLINVICYYNYWGKYNKIK